MRRAEARDRAAGRRSPHADASFNVARAALLGAGLARGDASLLAAAFEDRLHEPYRPSPLLDAIRADLPAGAVGATLSGSGPTVIVWAEDAEACATDADRALPRRDRPDAGGLRRRRALNLPWELELGEPFFAPYSKLVAPVRLADGTEAVLKIPLDDDTESVHEPEALRFWDGQGAVRLIDHDPATRALPDRALRAGHAARRRVRRARRWRSPRARWSGSGVEPSGRCALATARRATRSGGLEELPERYEARRPYEGRLLDEALDAIRELAPTQERLVLCHQDLHGGNLLRAEREPWLVIDSKPIVAEPAYDAVRRCAISTTEGASRSRSSGAGSTSSPSGSGSTASGCGSGGWRSTSPGTRTAVLPARSSWRMFSAVGSS